MHTKLFFSKREIPGACSGVFSRITMQRPLFPSELKMFHEVKRDYYSDCFFQSTRTDQNSSTKVLQKLMVSNCIIWPSELNQKGFPSFSA